MSKRKKKAIKEYIHELLIYQNDLIGERTTPPPMPTKADVDKIWKEL